MPKVLIFESETSFANELTNHLERRGCSVTVVDDASAGLQAAGNNRPDLILLAIELPRMNGFSVCNKLRRDPGLKDVPLIIMSSDSTQETFDQHKRLRTCADEYVHKPISFDDLLPHISRYLAVPGEDGGAGESPTYVPPEGPSSAVSDELDFEDDDIEIDDEVELLAPGEAEAEAENVDNEVDQFTEDAFDAIMEEGAAPSSKVEQGGGSAAVSAAAAGIGNLDLEEEEFAELPPATKTSTGSLRRSSAPPSGELLRLREELQDAQRRVSEAEAQIAEQKKEKAGLQTELDAAVARARHAASSGGGSARDILDLREQLNKKEKELLDLRDELTAKQKELLSVKDSTLALEREKADLNDQVIEQEKQLHAVTRAKDSAEADKDQAAKRADDHKRKAEKLAEELKEERDRVSAINAERAAAEEQARKDAEAKLESALNAARESAERERTEAVSAAQAEAQAEAQAQLAAAAEQHQQLLAQAQKEHADERAALEGQKAAIAEELSKAQQALESTRQRLQTNAASMDRAKDALAAALEAIEEVESTPSA